MSTSGATYDNVPHAVSIFSVGKSIYVDEIIYMVSITQIIYSAVINTAKFTFESPKSAILIFSRESPHKIFSGLMSL